MDQTRLVNGNRGGVALIHQNHKHHKNKKRNNFIDWRCWRKHCRSAMKTNNFIDDGGAINVIAADIHQHDNNV